MNNALVFMNFLSVFIMIGCVVVFATQESSRMQNLAMTASMMMLICCIGFMIKSDGKTADTLIVGQKLVYASVTHAMFLMLLFILEYCKFRIPNVLRWICHGINLLITGIVFTLDYHKLFYVRYWAEDIGEGHIELMKEYGPIHTLAVAVFGIYMASAVVIAVIFSVKNIRARSRYVWMLLVAVSFPCAAYIIPKLTDTNNEFQPIAFALFTVMLIFMVYRSNLYDVNNIAAQYSVKSVRSAIVVFDSAYSYKGCNDLARKLFPFLTDISVDQDIRGVSDILKDSLDGKKTEYFIDDTIYSIAVRPVTSGETVIGRVLWLKDVTMERKYTELLQKQKRDLESQVETLYDISNTDEMTGLYNRRAYEHTITELRSQKNLSGLVIAEVDINGLKDANDRIGHNAGDELIIGTADILKEVFSKYGSVFRTGGDEFFVIIPKKCVEIPQMRQELTRAIRQWHGVLCKKLSLAYGFVCSDNFPKMNVDELMIAADKAMYQNKSAHYASLGQEKRR